LRTRAYIGWREHSLNAAGRSLPHLHILGAFGAVVIGLSALFSFTGIPSWLPPALLVRFGVPSPLTGMTRSFVALVSGDLSAAFAWHPLGPVCFVACASLLPLAALSTWSARSSKFLSRVGASRAFWLTVAGAFALAWVRQIIVLH
jgi:hypothetical protein